MDVLLVLDVGNTNTSVGLFHGKQLTSSWRLKTDHRATSDDIGLKLELLLNRVGEENQVIGCIVSCVVPPLVHPIVQSITTYFDTPPLIVGPGIRTGIPIRYEDPRELGADRIANAVAAVAKYQRPTIILDLGTATTLSVIDDRGQYLGGAIAPGAMVAADALFTSASRLPQVETTWPDRLVQRNTVLSMQAGILYGAAAMVDGLVRKAKQEYDLTFTTIATGGVSNLLADHLEEVDDVLPYLTLEGLRILWERNSTKLRTS
ncbi:type III pantothenate kinase [Alicyclobacillus dauci]|uniref:Type III pantothenate kinase n=1 Tax=Alicyclobacillus dauci TaxID=1475485 RepID=A0ABY6Z3C7_9BACL|nr:type III pantothenate kinase [Alicyclobacillus dauci]WAH37352.1 type III pantothenate kinase [Alicyclobacillus dauci]